LTFSLEVKSVTLALHVASLTLVLQDKSLPINQTVVAHYILRVL